MNTTQERYKPTTFPTVSTFYYTGEDLNPWRCECCVTSKQRKRIRKMPTAPANTPAPECCRKCGITFNL